MEYSNEALANNNYNNEIIDFDILKDNVLQDIFDLKDNQRVREEELYSLPLSEFVVIDENSASEYSPSSGVYSSTPSPDENSQNGEEQTRSNLDISKTAYNGYYVQEYQQQFYYPENPQYFPQPIYDQQSEQQHQLYQHTPQIYQQENSQQYFQHRNDHQLDNQQSEQQNQLYNTPQIYQQENSEETQQLSININIVFNYEDLSSSTERNNDVQQSQGSVKSTQKNRRRQKKEKLTLDPIICKDCGKTFTRECYYMQHVKSVHTYLPHRCETCGKKYADEAQLLTHMKQHNAIEKQFKCNECPKQFHYVADLRRHKIKHSKTSRHVCDVCNKIFARKDHMVKHKLTHRQK